MGNVYLNNGVTPQGSAKYFKVNTVINEYEGQVTGYVANVYFSEADTKTLVAFVDKAIADAKASKEFTNAKSGKPVTWRQNPRVPYKTDEDGKTYFLFKKSHLDKDGNRQYVPMFDSQNKPMKNDVTVGNDSIVQMSYTPNVYHKNEDVNGVKFFLNAVRVVKLETYDSNPFGAPVEGYVAEQDTPFGNVEETKEVAVDSTIPF